MQQYRDGWEVGRWAGDPMSRVGEGVRFLFWKVWSTSTWNAIRLHFKNNFQDTIQVICAFN